MCDSRNVKKNEYYYKQTSLMGILVKKQYTAVNHPTNNNGDKFGKVVRKIGKTSLAGLLRGFRFASDSHKQIARGDNRAWRQQAPTRCLLSRHPLQGGEP